MIDKILQLQKEKNVNKTAIDTEVTRLFLPRYVSFFEKIGALLTFDKNFVYLFTFFGNYRFTNQKSLYEPDLVWSVLHLAHRTL